jgi:hypothetical protein
VPSPTKSLNGSASETFLEETLAACSLQGNLKDIVCTHGLKILHLNVRSLNGKLNELHSILSTLNSGIHLLTLSETLLVATFWILKLTLLDIHYIEEIEKPEEEALLFTQETMFV